MASSLTAWRMPRSQMPATQSAGRSSKWSRALGALVPHCVQYPSSPTTPPHSRQGARGPAAVSTVASPGRAVTALIGLTSSRGLASVSRAAAGAGVAGRVAHGLAALLAELRTGSSRAPHCEHFWGMSVT